MEQTQRTSLSIDVLTSLMMFGECYLRLLETATPEQMAYLKGIRESVNELEVALRQK